MNPLDVVLPSICRGELLLGAEKSVGPHAKAEVEAFLANQIIIPFGEPEMRIHARIRAHLETAGLRISDNDLIVAATSLLVTRTTRGSSRAYRV